MGTDIFLIILLEYHKLLDFWWLCDDKKTRASKSSPLIENIFKKFNYQLKVINFVATGNSVDCMLRPCDDVAWSTTRWSPTRNGEKYFVVTSLRSFDDFIKMNYVVFQLCLSGSDKFYYCVSCESFCVCFFITYLAPLNLHCNGW